MTILFKELELKFIDIEAKIEVTIKRVNDSYINENELLEKKYGIESLFEKYSSQLNIYREGLLAQISNNLVKEINYANEILTKYDKNSNMQTRTRIEILRAKKHMTTKKMKFKCSLIKSNNICIRKLINSEFKFGKRFSLSQLIKYKLILRLGHFLDLNYQTSLISAAKSGNLELVKNFVENGVDVNGRDFRKKNTINSGFYIWTD